MNHDAPANIPERERYDEVNAEWLDYHTASLRRDLCIALFAVGLVLSHRAIVLAGCVMGLGLMWTTSSVRDEGVPR